jgi:NAD(P)-dependent dehydrogenase (short-subunit alcohol dehydrogenase family)
MAKKVWTLDDAPNQKGRVFIVTGGNSGIGYETVKGLVKKEATVIMASRNMEKAKKAKETIENEIPSADITIMQLDLASLKSVDDFAEIFKSKYDRLDVLINNAGIMFTKYGLT